MKTDIVENGDKVVAFIYESWDYSKFKVLAENRGLKYSGGVSQKKINQLQNLINTNMWVDEESLVKVNENFVITQGAHNFFTRKQNNMPIRYTFMKDHRFNNGTSRRKLVNSILSMNTVDTSWKRPQIFNAAVYTKCPLALLIQELIVKHKNRFRWQDIMGIITKEEDYFSGLNQLVNLDPFCDKEYIEIFNSPGFKAELKYFLELNNVVRVSHRKGLLLKAIYSIINQCKQMVDVRAFMDVILSLHDNQINSPKLTGLRACINLLIAHYNKEAGKSVVAKTISWHITKNNQNRTKNKKREFLEPEETISKVAAS